MNTALMKTLFCLLLMVAVLVMAFITKDVVNSKLFASLGIIIGALVSHNLSTCNKIYHEQY
jgi:hypothetical protein